MGRSKAELYAMTEADKRESILRDIKAHGAIRLDNRQAAAFWGSAVAELEREGKVVSSFHENYEGQYSYLLVEPVLQEGTFGRPQAVDADQQEELRDADCKEGLARRLQAEPPAAPLQETDSDEGKDAAYYERFEAETARRLYAGVPPARKLVPATPQGHSCQPDTIGRKWAASFLREEGHHAAADALETLAFPAASPQGGAEHPCYACLDPRAPRPGAYCSQCEALRQTTLVCTACGDYPARAALIPADAKPGDQCPCCFAPNMDCDGTLIDSKPASPVKSERGNAMWASWWPVTVDRIECDECSVPFQPYDQVRPVAWTHVTCPDDDCDDEPVASLPHAP